MNQGSVLNYEYARQYHSRLLFAAKKQALASSVQAAGGKPQHLLVELMSAAAMLAGLRNLLVATRLYRQQPSFARVSGQQAGACC